MRSLPSVDLRADAILHLKRAGAELVEKSEELRETIDKLETAMLVATGAECEFPRGSADKLFERLQKIRRLRNTMEAFELNCRITEAAEKAWEALP